MSKYLTVLIISHWSNLRQGHWAVKAKSVYTCNGQLHQSSHQPLMMEAKTVSEMLETNFMLMQLIT